MSDDEDLAAIALIILLKKKKTKRIWAKEWLKRRPVYTHEHLLTDLASTQASDYKNYLRLDIAKFEELLQLVRPLIEKQNTVMREAITVFQRLSITLRYLATGNTFEDLKFASAISPQSLGVIIIETCEAITLVLKDYIKLPQTSTEWQEVAKDFEIKWNAPHFLGALDGKHVEIQKPPDSGSLYYNYKKTFSIVLMALVNANYEFMMVDVGTNGRVSDGGVLQKTTFGKKMKEHALDLPSPQVVTGTTRTLPYVFVADDAFPMGPNLMKPYAQSGLTTERRILNYRLSRGRRLVESAFGILAMRFGVFQRAFSLRPVKVRKIVLACCYLHNFLRRSTSYLSPNFIPHEDIQTGTVEKPTQEMRMVPLQSVNQRNSLEIAKKARNDFCDYFNNEGAVHWQNKFVQP